MPICIQSDQTEESMCFLWRDELFSLNYNKKLHIIFRNNKILGAKIKQYDSRLCLAPTTYITTENVKKDDNLVHVWAVSFSKVQVTYPIDVRIFSDN